MVEIITSEFIKKVYEEEKKDSKKLSKIPEDFFEKASEYLKNKKKISQNKESSTIKNLENILEEIFNMREKKIINFALIASRTNINVENLTKREEKMFNKLKEALIERREEFVKILKGSLKYIIFKKDYPQFVGFDGKKYGPFKNGEKIRYEDIPEEFAKILLKNQVIEIVEE